jgi:hypothetical protein
MIAMISFAVVLAGWATSMAAPVPLDIESIACGDGQLFGLSSSRGLMVRHDPEWRPFETSSKVYVLWEVPDGPPLGYAPWGPVVALAQESSACAVWNLPPEGGHDFQFSFANGPIVASAYWIYRLAPHGVVQDLGPAPENLTGFRSHSGPVLIRVGAGWVACFASSTFEADGMHGHCVRTSGRYDYPVEFDASAAPLAERGLGRPFGCGDVVVSVHRGVTWARRISDGRVVGHANVAARKGSRCLSDGRILVVGKRDLVIYDGPRFRRVWRRAVGSLIANVALCGTQLNVLLERDSSLTTVELPGVGGANAAGK